MIDVPFFQRIQMPDYTDVAAEATFVDYFGSVEEFSKFHSAYTVRKYAVRYN